MSLGDVEARLEPVFDDLETIALLVALPPTSFLLGLILGAESIAAGSPTFPKTLLPGYLYRGQATQEFLQLYYPTTHLMWVIAGILVVLSLLKLRNRLAHQQ